MGYEPQYYTLKDMELICIEKGWPATLAKLAFTGQLTTMYAHELKRSKKESFNSVMRQMFELEKLKQSNGI
jgi:hypothetical protein